MNREAELPAPTAVGSGDLRPRHINHSASFGSKHIANTEKTRRTREMPPSGLLLGLRMGESQNMKLML